MCNPIIIRLENGLKVSYLHNSCLKSCVLHLRGKAGSQYETDIETGSAHLLEHWILKGTENSQKKLIIQNGGKLVGITSRADVLFGIHLLKDYLGDGLAFLSEILYKSRLDPANINGLKSIISKEIYRHLDSPEKALSRLAYKILFNNARLQNLNTGSIENVENLTAETIQNFYDAHYLNDNFILFIYGNLNEEELVNKLNKYFTGNTAKSIIKEPNCSFNNKLATQVHNGLKCTQNYLRIDFPGENLNSSNKFVSVLTAKCLSFLVRQIMQEHSAVAYKTSVDSFNSGIFGIFSFYGVVDNTNIRTFIKNIKRLLKQGDALISENLVTAAKNRLIADSVFASEKPTVFAEYYSELILHSNDLNKDLDVINSFKKLTVKDVIAYLRFLQVQQPKITAISNFCTEQDLKDFWLTQP